MPPSVQRMTLLRTVSSFLSEGAGPSRPPFLSSYLASNLSSNQSSSHFGPAEVKSSPWTLIARLRPVWTNTHGLASPCLKPIERMNPAYSCCQPSAAARVPYICFRRSPHESP